jgi:hypothetical protein
MIQYSLLQEPHQIILFPEWGNNKELMHEKKNKHCEVGWMKNNHLSLKLLIYDEWS